MAIKRVKAIDFATHINYARTKVGLDYDIRLFAEAITEYIKLEGIVGKQGSFQWPNLVPPIVAVAVEEDRPMVLSTRSKVTLCELGVTASLPYILDKLVKAGVLYQPGRPADKFYSKVPAFLDRSIRWSLSGKIDRERGKW